MKQNYTLAALMPGQSAEITGMQVSGSARRRMQEIGFREGASVTCLFRHRSGEPAAFHVCGAVMALREEEMTAVEIGMPEMLQPDAELSCCGIWG